MISFGLIDMQQDGTEWSIHNTAVVYIPLLLTGRILNFVNMSEVEGRKYLIR